MSLTESYFDNCTTKEFYESMLYCTTKMNKYLDMMLQNPIDSGKYIDARVMMLEWQQSFDAASLSLKNNFGEVLLKKIVDMIDGVPYGERSTEEGVSLNDTTSKSHGRSTLRGL